MDIIQISALGITGTLLSVILKKYRPEFSVLCGIVTGMIIFSQVVGYFREIFSLTGEMISAAGVSNRYFTVLVKITSVACIAEIASELCRDAGENAIAVKIEMAGKIIIMLIAMPVIKGFLEVCINAINML